MKMESLSGRKLRKSIMGKYRDLLIEKLGYKCVKCDITDENLLCVDHVFGSGNIERKRFKSSEAMFRFYLEHFDIVKHLIQLLCYNHNREKQRLNGEYRKPLFNQEKELTEVEKMVKPDSLDMETFVKFKVCLYQMIGRGRTFQEAISLVRNKILAISY